MKALTAATLFVLLAANAHAATYSISPGGTDTNSGSPTAPWRTLAKAK